MACTQCRYNGYKYVFTTRPHVKYTTAKQRCQQQKGEIAVVESTAVSDKLVSCCKQGEYWVDIKRNRPLTGNRCTVFRLPDKHKQEDNCNNNKGYICQIPIPSTKSTPAKVVTTPSKQLTTVKVFTTETPRTTRFAASKTTTSVTNNEVGARANTITTAKTHFNQSRDSTSNTLGNSYQQSGTNVGAAVGAVMAVVALLLVFGFVVFCRRRRKKKCKWDFEILVKQRPISGTRASESTAAPAQQEDFGYYTIQRFDSAEASTAQATENIDPLPEIVTNTNTESTSNTPTNDSNHIYYTATNEKEDIDHGELNCTPAGSAPDGVYATVQKKEKKQVDPNDVYAVVRKPPRKHKVNTSEQTEES